jgi:hypothetical protein
MYALDRSSVWASPEAASPASISACPRLAMGESADALLLALTTCPTAEGVRAWRDMVIAAARTTGGKGGCPLGSLGGQLAETDPDARALIAHGFARWSAAIRDGLRAQAAGHLPAGVSPDDLAVTLLAALQGGLLLAQVQRDTGPLETAFDTILALAAHGEPAHCHRRGGTRPAPRAQTAGGAREATFRSG